MNRAVWGRMLRSGLLGAALGVGDRHHASGHELHERRQGPRRGSPAMPQLPTIAESGVPGYEYTPWSGWFGPGELPELIAERVHRTINNVLAAPVMRDQLGRHGMEVEPMMVEGFAEIVRADVARRGKIIRDTGIRAA